MTESETASETETGSGSETGSETEAKAGTKSTVKVSLGIHGTFDPADVTALLGLAPSRTWRRADRLPAGRHFLPPREADGWVYTIGPREVAEISPMVDEVLAKFFPQRERFADLRDKYPDAYLEIASVIYVVDAIVPALHLTSPTIDMLARLSLEYDQDLYVL